MLAIAETLFSPSNLLLDCPGICQIKKKKFYKYN